MEQKAISKPGSGTSQSSAFFETSDSIFSLWTASGRIATLRKVKAKQRRLGYDC